MDKWALSPNTNEFIIHTPHLPRPWFNYLTNGRYFALTSQTGGGLKRAPETPSPAVCIRINPPEAPAGVFQI